MAIVRPSALPDVATVDAAYKLIVDKPANSGPQSISIANFVASAGSAPADNSITNAKLADMAQKTWKRGPVSGTGDPIDDTTTNVKSDLLNAGILAADTTALITKGYTVTPNNLGTVSSGTTTLNGALHNIQLLTNNGAFTLAAPTSDTSVDLWITNGASAGSITFSGFTVGSNTGEPLTTTNGHKFIVSVRRAGGTSTYVIKALQ